MPTDIENYKTPKATTDVVIEYKEGIVLIERKNPPHGWALPGGFHEYGLTCEQNAAKEAKEETNLDIEITDLLGVYSDPKRDPRYHTMTVVFVAKGTGELKSGDDAKDAKVVKENDIPWDQLRFDHGKIIKDYLEKKKGKKQ